MDAPSTPLGHRQQAVRCDAAAMASAEVGDDWYGDDPTVNRLRTWPPG